MRSLAPIAPIKTFAQAFMGQHEVTFIEKTHLFFPRSGHALEYTLKLFAKNYGKQPRVLFPSYFCREVLRPLSPLCKDIGFFSRSEIEACVPSKDEMTDFDIIVVVDYFGLKGNYKKLHSQTRKNKQWLVVDRAHCFDDTKAKNAEFTFYSYHKTYGNPLGAILRVGKPQFVDSNLHDQIVEKKPNWFLWIKYFIRSIFRISSKYKNDSFFDTTPGQYSLNERRLSKLDISWMKVLKMSKTSSDRMIGNQINKDIVNLFSEGTKLYPEAHYHSVFECPNRMERDELVKKLQALGMMPVSWPDLSWGKVEDSDSALKERFFFLPNHRNAGYQFYLKRLLKTYSNVFKFHQDSLKEWEAHSRQYNVPSFVQDGFYLSNRNYPLAKRKYYRVSFEGKDIAAFICFESFFYEYHNLSPARPNTQNNLLLSLALRDKFTKGFKLNFLRPALYDFGVNYFSFLSFLGMSLSFGNLRSGVITLDGNINDLEHRVDKKWLNELKKSFDLCQDVKFGPIKNRLDFVRRYDAFCKQKKFSGIELSTLRHLISQSEKCTIFSALSGEEVVGEIAIYLHGNTATYLIGMSSEQGRKININYYLLWKAIEFCIERKILYFDIGGLSEQDNGIDHFKRGLRPLEYRTQDFYLCLA